MPEGFVALVASRISCLLSSLVLWLWDSLFDFSVDCLPVEEQAEPTRGLMTILDALFS